jgi:hypothetical protein
VIVYIDTSALVKLLVDEPGTDVAVRAWGSADVRVASVLVYAEARAAIAAGRRGRRLTRAAAEAARAALDDRWEELHRVDVTAAIAAAAGDLADRHGLRGADAVHLATAVTTGAGTGLLLLTWDAALARAGRRYGAATVSTL